MISLEAILQATNPLENSISVGGLHLEKYSQRWRDEIWNPYNKQKGVMRSLFFTAAIPTFDKDIPFTKVTLDIKTDEVFFIHLFGAYLKLGSTCIDALLNSSTWKSLIPHTQKFVLSTIGFLEKILFLHLVEIERDATEAALKENKTIKDRLILAEGGFVTHKYPAASELVSISSIDENGKVTHHEKNDLYNLLKAYLQIKSKIEPLNKRIEERNQKDGSTNEQRRANREKFPYKQKWLDVWQGPYRDLVIELQNIVVKIYAIFPPALLILDDLEDDIKDYWQKELGNPSDKQYRVSRDVQLKYDSKMRRCIKDSLLEMEQVVIGLQNPGISSALLSYLQQDIEQRLKQHKGIFSFMANYCLEERPGVVSLINEPVQTAGMILGVYESETWRQRENYSQTNRIMGHIRPLVNLISDSESSNQSLKDVLIRSYVFDLQRTQISLAKSAQHSKSMWRLVQISFGVIAMVAGVVTLIFGFGSIPISAGLAMLATAGKSILFILGMTLLIKTAIDQINIAGEEATALRNSFIDMALSNPETFLAFGENMARNRNALKTAGVEVIKQVTLIALARFRIIEIVMEIEMHVNTVDMVMGLFSDDSTFDEGLTSNG